MRRGMIAADWARRGVGLAIAGGAFAMLGGCVFVDFAEVVGAPFSGYAAPAVPIATVAAFMQKHGPMVIVQNDTGGPVEVRYWVGKMDIAAPNGVADLRTRDDLLVNVPAGESAMSQLGRSGWVTGNSDAVVRVRFTHGLTVPAAEGAEPAGDGSDVFPAPASEMVSTWYELKGPFPAVVRASNADDGTVVFERVAMPMQDRAKVPELAVLSPELWVAEANGPHPVIVRP